MTNQIVNQTVTISLVGKKIQISKEPAYISIPGGVVTWVTQEENFKFKILFHTGEDTPFGGNEFHGWKGTPAVSGAALPGKNKPKYPYTVEPTNRPDVLTLDPTVRPTP